MTTTIAPSVPRGAPNHYNIDGNWRLLSTAALGRHLRRYRDLRAQTADPTIHGYAGAAIVGISRELHRRGGVLRVETS